MRSTWTAPLSVLLTAFAVSAFPGRLVSTRNTRRQISPSLYAPAFLPTPLPPLPGADAPYVAAAPAREGHRLAQPRKPVYHYTPIKPFSEEDLGDTYRGKKGRPSPTRDLAQSTSYVFGGGANPFQAEETLRGAAGPQVHEYSDEPSVVHRPIQPPTPIAPEPTVHAGPGVHLQVALPGQGQYHATPLIPDTELVDIKAIRLGEAVAVGSDALATSAVLQRQNPAYQKYHFEYRVRDHEGEFGHAEAKDGPLTSGGYDVNLHKTHVQSVRYFVDSKEVPIYAHQFHHVL